MALQNGVLVHGPTAWACAVRTPDGTLKVAAERKRFREAGVENPLVRGPARLLDGLLLLPTVRRRLPESRLPFERPGIFAAMAGSLVAIRLVRRSGRVPPAIEELVSGLLSLAPATLALRSRELAAYHGAEHISIGSYEHGSPRPREHERCGTHLVGPLLFTSAIGAALAAKAPERMRGPARLVASIAAMAGATE